MRYSKILLFLFFFIASLRLEAQTNFLKGYYVTFSRDTVHGFIEYRFENRNQKVCAFRKELNGEIHKFFPMDIAGFTIDEKIFYESHSFKTRMGVEFYGFFKVVVRGYLSLLQYESISFVKASDGEVFDISKKSAITDGKLRVDNRGLGMLFFLMADCEEISRSTIERYYKSSAGLTEIFVRYNQCKSSPAVMLERMRISPHFDFGLQTSLSLVKLELSSSLKEADLANELCLGAGGFISVFLPKVDERIRLVIEGNYNQYKNYAYFSSENTNNDLFIEYSSLRVPILLRYNFDRIFFDFGIQNQFVLGQDLKWRIETIQQDIIYTNDGYVEPFKGWTSGYTAGVGLKYTLAGYSMRSMLRYSSIGDSSNTYYPTFKTFDLMVSVQLTK